MFSDRPFTGQGFGNFESLYMYFQADVIKKEESLKKFAGGFVSHPHNEVAFIVAQSGMLGLAGLLIVLTSFLRLFLKMGLQKTGLYMALFSPFVVHMMVEYPLDLSLVHYVTFVLLVALMTSHFAVRKSLRIGRTVRTSVISVSVVLCLAFSLWMIKTLGEYMDMVDFVRNEKMGKLKPEKLEGPSKNLYLRNWAKPMYMIAKANKAIRTNDIKFLTEFIPWAEMEKIRRPVKEVFYVQALALTKLAQQKEDPRLLDMAMKVAQEGSELYPNWRPFDRLKILIFVLKNALSLPKKKE